MRPIEESSALEDVPPESSAAAAARKGKAPMYPIPGNDEGDTHLEINQDVQPVVPVRKATEWTDLSDVKLSEGEEPLFDAETSLAMSDPKGTGDASNIIVRPHGAAKGVSVAVEDQHAHPGGIMKYSLAFILLAFAGIVVCIVCFAVYLPRALEDDDVDTVLVEAACYYGNGTKAECPPPPPGGRRLLLL